MTDKAHRINKRDTATIEGIEIFDIEDGQDPTVTAVEVKTASDWTPEQAAKALGKSVRTIRRLLQDGTLKGYKVAGRRRDEWRVKPVSVSAFESVTFPASPIVREENDRLWELLKEKDAKLEALTMRTGYLEAQLESSREQIKLLVDSQRGSGSWWGRFVSWLRGSDR